MRIETVNRSWTRALVVPALLFLLGGCALPNCSPKTSGAAGTPAATISLHPSSTPTPTAPLQASTPPFHPGEVGVAYSPVTLFATGGVQLYTWTVSSGALPDGLGLGTDGTVSGTPTRAGGYTFTVQLSDAGGAATALPSTIAIAAAPVASLISACARYCSVEVGCADVCGGFGTLAGGTAPFTYAAQPGGLIPVGTHLSQLSLAGTFTQRAQFWQFTVVVTDALGQTASISPTFYVFPHISFVGGTITCPHNGCGAPSKLPYQGGSGTPQVRVTAWTSSCAPTCYQAPAPTVSANGGQVFIGVPPSRGGNGYQAVLAFVLTDTSLCGAGTYCSTNGSVTVVVQSG